MLSVFQYDVYVWLSCSMPEHLDARTTISRHMFYYILASKLPSQKKIIIKTSLPTIKFLKKRTLTNYFFLLGPIHFDLIHVVAKLQVMLNMKPLSIYISVLTAVVVVVFTLASLLVFQSLATEVQQEWNQNEQEE